MARPSGAAMARRRPAVCSARIRSRCGAGAWTHGRAGTVCAGHTPCKPAGAIRRESAGDTGKSSETERSFGGDGALQQQTRGELARFLPGNRDASKAARSRGSGGAGQPASGRGRRRCAFGPKKKPSGRACQARIVEQGIEVDSTDTASDYAGHGTRPGRRTRHELVGTRTRDSFIAGHGTRSPCRKMVTPAGV
jgi:hypothetical protein